MTPFDGTALLVMLLAFYPAVSPAALARARLERPEYFAGGEIIGSSRGALRLPDGRIFDLIVNAGGAPGTTFWQVLPMVPGDDDDSPWPLEPGPLTPIDVPEGAPGYVPIFEPIVAGALEQLGGVDGAIGVAEQRVAEGANLAARLDAGGLELDDVDGTVNEIANSHASRDFADIVGHVAGVAQSIDATDSDFDETPPDLQMPNEPETPPWPTDGGTEPGPPDPSEPNR